MALISTPMLQLLNASSNFSISLETYPFDTSIRAVLYYKDHPMVFFSRKLSALKHNYSIYVYDLLTIHLAIHSLRYYLHGRTTYVDTDQKLLINVFIQLYLSPDLIHWVSALAEFDLHIKYPPGYKNIASDE